MRRPPWDRYGFDIYETASFKGGGGGAQTQETIQKSEPWSEQKPYLLSGFENAQKLYESDTPSYFPGSTVAGFNPTQQTALGMGTQRALQGSETRQLGMDQANKTLSGDYLNAGNPYMSDVATSVNRSIRPALDSQFAGSGRYGSPNHQAMMAREMASAMAPYAYNTYGQERQNMQNMALAAPGLAQTDYNDIDALSRIGGTQQQQTQTELASDIDRHNFEQNLEANKLAQYMGLIGGNYGGTTQGTTTGTPQSPGKGGALGPALQLAGTGMQAYQTFSARGLKTSLGPADTVLDKIADMPVDRWVYKHDHPSMPKGEHVGPYADDFARLFGGDGVTIDMVTAFGVCLQAIKELTEEVRELKNGV